MVVSKNDPRADSRWTSSCKVILLATTVVLQSYVASSSFAQATSITSEAELIGILSSGKDRSEMAMACKRLAVFGSDVCIDEVAKLLSDPELASWARITLEAVPSPKAEQALRAAVPTLDGILLVGVINSLGARQDKDSVALLAQELSESDPLVVEAALLALGRIGGESAAETLLDFLASAPEAFQSVAAEACNLCADRLSKEGKKDLALTIFDKVRASELPVERIVEATRGAIVLRGKEGVPLLREQLRSSDRKLLALGLQTAREFSNDQLGSALIEEIHAAPPERAALLVEVLGDLSGQADLGSLLSLAKEASREVRLASISVLGRVGDVSCLEPILSVARQGGDLMAAARASLVAIQDSEVDREILDRLPGSKEDKLLLLELVGLRRIQATDELIKSLKSTDASERAAALQSLGETVEQDRLGVLVDQVLNSSASQDAGAATRALRTAAVRMPDRDQCAVQLGSAMKSADANTRATILEIVAAVAGPKSLEILADYAKTGDEALRDVSTRLLGEWMTIDVAPVLLDLASSGQSDRFQVRAMRGYIRVCRQFVMSEDERVQMCEKALQTARNIPEQKLVLEVLQRYPCLGTLKIALDAGQIAGVQSEARSVAKAIGQKLADNTNAQKMLKDAGL